MIRTEKGYTKYIKGEFSDVLDKKSLVELKHLELLPCGHQNNLNLEGRKTGVCPKGCQLTTE